MRQLIKVVLVSALVLFIGLPLAFVAFVFCMAALGVAIGIGGAILGLVFAVLKVALLVAIPVLLLYWLATRLTARDRSY